ncbi:2-amino-4-hydroxy-6-hydroxymethyldihydropteridine diphosphokinase [Novosphingobium sp. Gsoil 351]|uniref:2-amino-4-hydroxy-6- hydroxymethyldihydropteridine diphosphokinase n=1 Tax=Novosphingobium sp. Gsoil 351 TaxID=2675225 RepID=UPI0012B44074|nr:2-amino-4-hydroxy-6-hydroxymethyldihydropteridine diphosphokinase [Novosphingobium sp. Gsoil 351]QGN56374.1 2-amino-4-hydroxy-6-hydroxymethyldihydropteridine diphosphokinase [Novosphingobium sp. Gsoil 351]
MRSRYLIAVGGNVRHPRYGSPPKVLRAALRALDGEKGIKLKAASRIVASAPLGPSQRRYANAAVIVRSKLDPPALLARLQAIEHRFARRRRGRRWGARTLDLDIVLWSMGAWASPGLAIPHPAYRTRGFVLAPALTIARDWRDPLTVLTIAHLAARLTRRTPLPIRQPGRALSSVGRATDF